MSWIKVSSKRNRPGTYNYARTGTQVNAIATLSDGKKGRISESGSQNLGTID
jgi:hypothetical protein